MGKLIDYIAQQTEGEPFGSFKYGYDNDPQLRFPYEGETQPERLHKLNQIAIQQMTVLENAGRRNVLTLLPAGCWV